MLIFCIDKNLERTLKLYENNSKKLAGFDENQVLEYTQFIKKFLLDRSQIFTYQSWAARQSYIALGFAIYTCSLLGIDTCPIEGFDSLEVDKEIGLIDSDYASIVILAIGKKIENKQCSQKIRKSANELFF